MLFNKIIVTKLYFDKYFLKSKQHQKCLLSNWKAIDYVLNIYTRDKHLQHMLQCFMSDYLIFRDKFRFYFI